MMEQQVLHSFRVWPIVIIIETKLVQLVLLLRDLGTENQLVNDAGTLACFGIPGYMELGLGNKQ